MATEREINLPFANFETFDLTNPGQAQRLIDLIKPDNTNSGGWEFLSEGLIGRQLYTNCDGALLEHEYADADFLRAYAHYFSRLFRDIPRFAKRVHFFSKPIDQEMLLSLATLQDHYLGFSVIRPLRLQSVGRSILVPPPSTTEEYFPTLASHDVHICGQTLTVTGAAYMEQDSRVAACATAAIWMSTVNLASLANLTSRSTVEITQAATEFVSGERPLPSKGLNTFQMIEALRDMDYDPLAFRRLTWDDAKRVTYSYVESGISPILVINLVWPEKNRHAVTAIGHGYKHSSHPGTPDRIELYEYFSSNRWADSFRVNDDQYGPYRLMRHDSTAITAHGAVNGILDGLQQEGYITQEERDSAPSLYEKLETLPVVGIDHYFAVIEEIIVPNPPRVSLTAYDAERKSLYALKAFLEPAGVPEEQSLNLVLRTYLIESVKYQQAVAASMVHAKPVTRIYLGKPMPKWIWVTEISRPAEYQKEDLGQRRLIGEVLLDGTSNPHLQDFLAVHFLDDVARKGYLATMMREDANSEAALDNILTFDEEPYPSMITH